MGPGLLVNALLKNQWGRARPRQVDLFGGEAPYTPVWQIVDHCEKNCSFVSGEASSATWLLALVFLAPVSWRKPLAATIGALAVSLSLNRVAFGGHFLSDTVLSWLLTFAVVLAVYRAVYVRPLPIFRQQRLEGAADRAGDKIRARMAALWQAGRRRAGAFLHHLR